ncbi:MAG: DUF2809 domain-containing protein [Pseudanabaena sp.]|jgi:hypothetical protein
MFANRLIFNRKYFYLTVLLFLIEVYIAIFVKDQFIRPFGGDVLVVILLYCFVRSFWKINTNIAAVSVFIFACAIEGLQYLNLLDRLGWRQYKLLAIILGTTFSWEDIFAYATGTAIILGSESLISKFGRRKH